MNVLPRVGMIYLPNNPISMKYREVVSQSWIAHGHGVDYHAGITPDTFDQAYRELNFGKKMSGRNKGRDFTETEKAVWYSHLMMWDIAARKRSPLIIVEHDVIQLKPLDMSKIEQYPCLGICHCGMLSNKPEKGYRISAGGAYVLTPDMGKHLVDNLPKTIETNSDGYIYRLLSRYGSFEHHVSTQLYIPEWGGTIAHD